MLHDLFKYNDKRSIVCLALDLLHEPPKGDTKINLMAMVLYADLMNFPGPKFIKWVLNLGPSSFKQSFCKNLVTAMEKDGYLSQAFNDTIRHMAQGVDKTDSRSAGGWGELEFNKFLSILSVLGYEPPDHVKYKLQSNQSIITT